MFEALVLATATTGLFALARGARVKAPLKIDPRLVVTLRDERGDDLPCPWCYAPTHENDANCGSCGRSFG
jgi:hypothetical protein